MSDEHGPGSTPQRPWQAGPPAPSAQHFAAYPSSDVLATHDPEPGTEPQRARWAVVALAGCLVLALVGGVSWAVGSLSGGGAQPEDALPAGAVAFAKVDLDPPAGQKIDGFRFLRKFPDLRERIPLDGDVRKVLFESFAEQAGWQDIDFDTEVDPWLGDRLGVAGYPAGEGEQTTSPGVVALQVTDAAKAEDGLRRLVAASQDRVGGTASVGFVVEDGYALLAESQELAETYARKAAEKTLAEDERYAGDVAELGDGVAAVWVDNAAAARSGNLLDPSSIVGLGVGDGLGAEAGRTTMVARFDGPDVFEVVGSVTDIGPAGWATHPVSGLGDLPESTVLAFGLADGDELAPRVVDALRTGTAAQGEQDMVARAEQELGIELPDDLAVLLGDNLVAALDGTTTDDGEIQAAARVATSDVGRARQLIQRLVADGPDLVLRTGDGQYVVGSTEGLSDRLASGEGGLGDQPAFRQALPDLADAEVALWVDPAGLVTAIFGGWDTGSEGDESDSGLEPIAGVGLTASSQDDGRGTFRFRIVAR
jgi:hypothetical protein